MSDDYLFDKRGAPDPEVERLEKLLARHRFGPHPMNALEVQRARRFRARSAARWATAAAILVVITFGVWIAIQPPGRPPAHYKDLNASYRVEGLARVESVSPGDRLATGSEERARVEIGTVGHLDVEPNTTLRVEGAPIDHHGLFLERGDVHAKILAQPRTFQIGTPAGRSIDLGCEYTLHVNERGESLLRVTTGQVAFEFDGREIYVPAHASCTSAPGRGPSTPVFDISSKDFRDALAAVEFEKDPSPTAIAKLIDAAEREDSLSLWHLFDSPKTAPALQSAAYTQLAKGFPPPEGDDGKSTVLSDRSLRARWLETLKPAWRTGF